MHPEEITDRIAWPCGWCGQPMLRLVACEMPPPAMLTECMFSGDYNDPLWRICARSTPGRFAGRFERTPA